MELENLEKLELLQELVMRWKRHRDFILTLEKTNVEKEQLELWKKQIENTFSTCIKSCL
tara:strand:+ start:404 stop:580 length:177 start_codon:yes stop_codon:yes gene_type:complete